MPPGNRNRPTAVTRQFWVSFIFIFLFFGVGIANPFVPSVKSPTGAIKELDRLADQYRFGKNLSAEDQTFNQDLKSKMLRGTFSLRELSRLALAKNWNARSAKEQDRFVELLTNLLEERSVFAKEKAIEKGEGANYQVNYKGEKYLNPEKTNALVQTIVRLPKQQIKIGIDYKLRKTGDGGWQIYDVIVEDASLVDNYRYSFDNIIKKQGYAELIRRMEAKLQEFRSKRSAL